MATAPRLALLTALVHTFIDPSPPTAVFYADALVLLAPLSESATHARALALLAASQPRQALEQLRRAVIPPLPAFDPASSPITAAPATNTRQRRRQQEKEQSLRKPAFKTTQRCASLYARACLLLGRVDEARVALMEPGLIVIDDEALPESTTGKRWVLDLALGRTQSRSLFQSTSHPQTQSGKGKQPQLGPSEALHRALESNPWCWEAVALLASHGPIELLPEADSLFVAPSLSSNKLPFKWPTPSSQPDVQPPQPQQPAGTTSHKPLSSSSSVSAGHREPLFASLAAAPPATAASAPVSQNAAPGQSSSGPPPLAMKTTNVPSTNPPLGPSLSGGPNHDAAALSGTGGGFFTPSLGGLGSGLFGPVPGQQQQQQQQQHQHQQQQQQQEKKAAGQPSFIPLAKTLPAPGAGGAGALKRARGQPAPAPAAHSFNSHHLPGGLPGGGGGPPTDAGSSVGMLSPGSSSVDGFEVEDSMAFAAGGGRRAVKPLAGAGAGGAEKRSSSSVRRSGRLNLSSGPGGAVVETKRGAGGKKAAQQQDGRGSSPSHAFFSASLSPSQPFNANLVSSSSSAPQAEAIAFVSGIVRCFARAAVAGRRYESRAVIKALGGLPVEVRGGARSLEMVGRAHFELLDYEKAEKAFAQMRKVAPYHLSGLDVYSTLLWHLRSSTSLSFLAQEMQAFAPLSPETWVAAGNAFSLVENHTVALQCFKRASQTDSEYPYAYTLAGHECVTLEEWERAMAFFREAIRRDERHYNAWFGLGNVYLHTGKLRLAKYHFSRAASLNPNNALLVSCVGTVLEKMGSQEEALSAYDRACELAPESPAVRFKRAKLLMALKKLDLAEQDLLELRTRAPNEFHVNFLLGKLYLALSNAATAAAATSSSSSAGPSAMAIDGPQQQKNRYPYLKFFTLAQDIDPRAGSWVRKELEEEKRKLTQIKLRGTSTGDNTTFASSSVGEGSMDVDNV